MSALNNLDLFYSGTSGLVLPLKKSQFPLEFRDKTILNYYSHLQNSVDINSSFYKLPKISTIEKWADSVPDNFRFTFKVSRAITHSAGLNFSEDEVLNFVNTINYVGSKRGCLLLQFPPSVKSDQLFQVEKLLKIFAKSVKDSSWKLAVEFRNSSCYNQEIVAIFQNSNAVLVQHDMKGSETNFCYQEDNFYYGRFHGPEPRYRGSYSIEFLKAQALIISNYLKEKKSVYIYFNNTMGAADSNLETLNNLIRRNP